MPELSSLDRFLVQRGAHVARSHNFRLVGKILVAIGAGALLIGGGLALFATGNPDIWPAMVAPVVLGLVDGTVGLVFLKLAKGRGLTMAGVKLIIKMLQAVAPEAFRIRGRAATLDSVEATGTARDALSPRGFQALDACAVPYQRIQALLVDRQGPEVQAIQKAADAAMVDAIEQTAKIENFPEAAAGPESLCDQIARELTEVADHLEANAGVPEGGSELREVLEHLKAVRQARQEIHQDLR